MKQPTRRSLRSHVGVAFRAGGPLFLLAALAACGGGASTTGGTGGQGGENVGGGGAGGGTSAASGGPAEPPRYRMRIDDAPVPEVVLELDKAKALELFGVDAAKQIRILDVDTTQMLANVLTTIQDACGTSWRDDNPDPMHDCSFSPLGESFGPGWQTSPEFALVRLLSMTPANADVTGTSLQDFQQLIDQNPGTFSFSFADVLAQSLGVANTDPFIPTLELVAALQQHLLGTHPAINDPSGTMPVTLYDALLDLAPLSQKLGPVGGAPWDNPGEHPGVLVPDDGTFVTHSDVLLPTFRMRVVAASNLRWVSGIDLSVGAGDMFLKEAATPLSFDFTDPQKLQITGINDSPTVDMRFSVRERLGVVPSCTQVPACKSNYPPPMGTPVGTDTVWAIPPWLLEPIVARSGLLTYGDRSFSQCYLTFNMVCQTGVDIGQNGDPLGWTVFTNTISFNGQPPITVPSPQFLWELLTEVAQVALHDPDGDGAPDLQEGQAEPVYSLYGVDIGLTGAEITAQMRPTLQSQADFIAETILGKFWKNNNALDFFYRRAAPGGDPYLFFVADTDVRPDEAGSDMPRPYTYDKPGFFTSPDLSDASKVSSKVLSGVDDTIHEKYRLPPGETTLYMQDDEQAVYEVRFYVPEGGDPVEIVADVSKVP